MYSLLYHRYNLGGLDDSVSIQSDDPAVENSWDILNRIKPNFVGTGSEIKQRFGICAGLPMQLNAKYAYMAFPLGIFNSYVSGALPFIPQSVNQMVGFAAGFTNMKQYCVAVNKDMFGFVIGPNPKPLKPTPG